MMLVCAVGVENAAPQRTGNMIMSKTAQDYVAAFERNEPPSPNAIIVNGQPDAGALAALGEALDSAGSSVREQVVNLLAEVARRTDPLTKKGADVIRDPKILALLAGPGLAKPDLGRMAAMDALRKLATQPDLSRFGGAFTKTLQDAPSGDAFLLVAKAKPEGAKPVVERLAALPSWRDDQAARIARAAFGASDIEDAFLARAAAAEAASDGKALGEALGTLGLIGTPRSLRAVAARLRTPLEIHMPGVYDKSVRLSVLEALLYNFPDQPELYPNNIITEADYSAAEGFCERTLGVRLSGPVPPFLTYRGYPRE